MKGGLFHGGTISNDFSLRTDSTSNNWVIEYGASNDDFTLNSSLNNWHHYALVYDGMDVKLYHNGVFFDQTTATLGTGSNNLEVARWNLNEFDGKIDAIKFSNVERSEDWICTEYNNQNSPSTFFTVGSNQAISNVTGLWSCRNAQSRRRPSNVHGLDGP